MPLHDLLSLRSIVPSLKATTKKQAIQDIAAHAARVFVLDERTVFDTLLQRERLGSTAIGGGIAIPHGKLPGLAVLHGMFLRLDRPIDFEALDGEPVDLIFLLLAPEAAGADHLKALARVARLLRSPSMVSALRAERDSDRLFALLTQMPESHAA